MSTMKKDENLARIGAYDEIKQWQKFRSRVFLASFVYATLFVIIMLPLHYVITDGWFSDANIDYIVQYFGHIWGVITLNVSPGEFISGYFGGWVQDFASRGTTEFPTIVLGLLIGGFIAIILA